MKERRRVIAALFCLASIAHCHAQGTARTPGQDASWADFEARWQAAMKSGDPASIASLTRLPFLLEGRKLDRAAFERAAPGLFTPRVRTCLARARARIEPGDPGDRVMLCAPYNFYFDAGNGTWKLREFGADEP